MKGHDFSAQNSLKVFFLSEMCTHRASCAYKELQGSPSNYTNMVTTKSGMWKIGQGKYKTTHQLRTSLCWKNAGAFHAQIASFDLKLSFSCACKQ